MAKSLGFWAYWRQVWRDAFRPKDPLDWATNAIAVLVAIAFFLHFFGRSKAVEEFVPQGVGYAIAFVIVGVIRFARSAYRIHLDDLANIARIEEQRDDARARVNESKEAAAAGIHARSKKDQAIVEALLPRIHIGTHEIANTNRPSANDEARTTWPAKLTAWEHETLAILKRAGCTHAEISSFWDYTAADLQAIPAPFPGYQNAFNHRGRQVAFRLRALKRIVNNHSDHEVFPGV